MEFVESRNALVIQAKIPALDIKWTIPLERLVSTADVKCEFLVKQLEAMTIKLNALSSSNDKLVTSNKEISESAKYLKQTIGLPEKIQCPMFAAINNTNFTLSADRKTLVRNEGTGFQGFVSEHSLLARLSAPNCWSVSLDAGPTRRMVIFRRPAN